MPVRFNVGDVGYIPFFPFQDDINNGNPRLIIVYDEFVDICSIVPCTTNLDQEARYKNTIVVYKNSEDGKKMGLPFDSLIIVDRYEAEFKTLRMMPFVKTGTCPDSILDKINLIIKDI